MRTGSLFSGYSGLDLAVNALLGSTTAWHSEIDKGACKVLAHRFPGVPNHGDITTIDWTAVTPVEVLTAGFPCQPVSHAGKRLGDDDERWLWDDVARAVRELRPGLVVLENVRGLLTAGAGRLFGRVLGTLADLGYDASWHGLRAADVGAPHGRWRVFIAAYPRGEAGQQRAGLRTDEPAGIGRRQSARVGGSPLLPTPTTRDHKGRNQRDDETCLTGALLPTPRATDGTKGGPNQRGSSGDMMLPSAVALLPTPAVNDMGEGKTPEAWDDWTARMKAAHGNGNGHGPSLAIEAQRLLPTPSVADVEGGRKTRSGARSDELLLNGLAEEFHHARTPETRPGEVLRDVREATDPQALRERQARGQDSVPQEATLLPELREQPTRGADRDAQMEGASGPQADGMPGVQGDRAPARTSPRPQPSEQRPDQPRDALRELSPEAALAGGPLQEAGRQPMVDWGAYAAAIYRWERVLGRPAPLPTQLSTKGNPQLSPLFVEFLMGLPEGWVTDVPGITRNEALKLCGNGVVPQQAEAALRVLLSRMAVVA